MKRREDNASDGTRAVSIPDRTRNKDFEQMGWLDGVVWDGEVASMPRPALIFDLNDQQMIFEHHTQDYANHISSKLP